MLVANVCEIEKLAIVNSKIERKIIENFMPGPLTIVLQKKNIVSDKLTAKKNTVGVRIPTNKIAQEILNACKEPLATSSANLSGKANKTDIKEIINELGDNVDIYINGKIDKLAQASTVIQVIDEKLSILRQGKITKEDINNVILN